MILPRHYRYCRITDIACDINKPAKNPHREGKSMSSEIGRCWYDITAHGFATREGLFPYHNIFWRQSPWRRSNSGPRCWNQNKLFQILLVRSISEERMPFRIRTWLKRSKNFLLKCRPYICPDAVPTVDHCHYCYLPCVPGIVAFINKEIKSPIFFLFFGFFQIPLVENSPKI